MTARTTIRVKRYNTGNIPILSLQYTLFCSGMFADHEAFPEKTAFASTGHLVNPLLPV